MCAEPPCWDVCVVGTGYVGLPLAIMLARAGRMVLGVDLQEGLVRAINEGRLPFPEPSMADELARPEVRARLRASTSPAPAAAFVLAVPTPLDPRRRVADLSALEAAARSLVPHLRAGNLVVVESTVPPGTCREVVAPILEESGLRVGRDLHLAHCPERILPGDVMYEIVHNDRIIGGVTPQATRCARELYASFVRGQLLETDDLTAELCKLMENTYRDVNIALANELAAVAETLGVDPLRAIQLANRHPRVHILKPGIGTGGHCIPIDPWFIHQVDPDHARLIETARRVNDEVPARIAAKIRRAVADLRAPRLALVGVTYKPDVADCRESPALRILDLLREDGYDAVAYDPVAPGYPWPDDGLVGVARGADCLVVLVEHSSVRRELEEREPDVLAALRCPRILRFYQQVREEPAPWQVVPARGALRAEDGR